VRTVVRDNWLAFTEPLEGGVAYPYADIRGLVTVAYGNLIDPMSLALSLPFLDANTGKPATREQIASGWQAVKNDPNARKKGHAYARGLTPLRLTLAGMSGLALGKLEANDEALRIRFAEWEDFPACAQMALHSLAWACGAAFHFPKLAEAVRAQDWDACSVHIHMNEYTPEGTRNAGLVPRNVRNRLLMANAERVRGFKLDPDTLEWTRPIDVSDEDTQPEVNAATHPTCYPAPEIVTGSGGTIHVGSYPLDVDPDDDAA
jgi:GH24 family phage-related lysozyme (muramidase)